MQTPSLIPMMMLLFSLVSPAMAEPPADAMPQAESGLTEPSVAADKQPGDERRGPLSPTDKIVLRFMELDSDASEGVSFEEYMAMVSQRAEDRFKSMDSNQDMEVSEEEFRNFWLTRKARWYRLRR